MVTGPTLAIIAIIALAALIFFSFRAQDHKQTQFASRLEVLGFQADQENLDIQKQLKHLYRAHGKIVFGSIYRKSSPQFDLFIFSMHSNPGESRSLVVDYAVALLSPQLQLPEFWIVPGIPRSGWLGATAYQAVSSVLSVIGFAPLAFEEDPAFNNDFTVFAINEQAMREVLTVHRRKQLGQLESPVISGSGNLLVLDNKMVAGQKKILSQEALIQRLEDASAAYQLFIAGE